MSLPSMEVGANAASGGPLMGRVWAGAAGFGRAMQKLGEDDPRRVTHALKEGLAITLVSLFYYLKPLYDGFGFGSNAMWAVLTVVVIFDFSVGGTIGKAFLRFLATMVGGALGFGAHRIAALTGERSEPIALGFFVFTIAAMATYVRFIPKMKAKYDYGLLIFILTFSMVAISGYQEEELFKIARHRVLTIVIGCIAAIVVCIGICPVWMGSDFHNHVALNVEKLANFLQGFENEYFKTSDDERAKSTENSFLEGYKSILTSKNTEETMANLASWEPPHIGGFRFRHPWKQYLQIATLTRHCAYKFEALNAYLHSQIQTHCDLRMKIHSPCTEICSEASNALRETSSLMRTMTPSSITIDRHLQNSKTAAENLKLVLKMGLWKDTNLLEMVQAAAVATLLYDVVSSVEEIVKSVNELARLAKFSKPRPDPNTTPHVALFRVQPICSVHGPREHEHIVTVFDESSPTANRVGAGEIGSELTLYELMGRHS